MRTDDNTGVRSQEVDESGGGGGGGESTAHLCYVTCMSHHRQS